MAVQGSRVPDRNAPCPCGSGKKYKHCHGKNHPIPAPANIASLTIDLQHRTRVFVTKDFLINQIERDGPAIAKSFDKIARKDLEAISATVADAVTPIHRHMVLEATDYQSTCANLLFSAISTYMASIEVARHGYHRPYGAIARGVVETIATIFQISIEPDALAKLHNDKLESTDSIRAAKKALPPFGRLYGFLSNQFVHINKGHATFEPTIKYAKRDEAVTFIISNLKFNAWLIYVAAELVFHSDVGKPRYWKGLGGGKFAYAPSDEEQAWQEEFFGPMPTEPAA